MARLQSQQPPVLMCTQDEAPQNQAGAGNSFMSLLTGGMGNLGGALGDPVGQLANFGGSNALPAAPEGGTAGTPEQATAPQNDPFQVDQGQLTFDAEGTEGGRYHSRQVHWPGGASGLTIGRGYDVGQWSEEQIRADFDAAGIDPRIRDQLIASRTLRGQAAQDWVTANRETPGQITAEQQEALLQRTCARLQADVERISSKDDVVERYGQIDWETVDPAIRDLLVDLRYRGDYTGATRRQVQELAVNNDVQGLAEVMANRDLWRSVPPDRFQRRMQYMQQAVQRQQQQQAPQTGPQ